MKHVLMIGVMFVAAAAAASDTTALVEASKAAKEKRKTSSTKVITNADVKKSKGKLVETKVPPAPAAKAPEQGSEEKHAAARMARAEAEAKVAAAQKQVAALESELAIIEQSYYQANDLDHRDRVIANQFETTKKKLEAARADLHAAQTILKPETTP